VIIGHDQGQNSGRSLIIASSKYVKLAKLNLEALFEYIMTFPYEGCLSTTTPDLLSTRRY
jgi:hypothetical protein